MARARQARSPSDKPKGRVTGSNSAAMRACCSVKKQISHWMLCTRLQACAAMTPRSSIRVWTSARLTVLRSAPSRMEMTISPPGSLRNTARTADESRTARSVKQSRLPQAIPIELAVPRHLLFLATGFFAALGDQFVRGQNAGPDVWGELPLNAPNARRVRLDAQNSVLYIHQQRVARRQAHLPPDGGRDDDAPVRAQRGSGMKPSFDR